MRSPLAVGVLFFSAFGARADIIVTDLRTSGAGETAGFDIVRLLALNNGANGTGSDLQFVDLTFDQSSFSPELAFKFRLFDLDGDGVADVDLFGRSDGFSTTSPQGTYVRIGAPSTWNVVFAPPGATSDTNGDGQPDTNPAQTF